MNGTMEVLAVRVPEPPPKRPRRVRAVLESAYWQCLDDDDNLVGMIRYVNTGLDDEAPGYVAEIVVPAERVRRRKFATLNDANAWVDRLVAVTDPRS